VSRAGARPGDLVYVSRPLGAAAAGLELCRAGEMERWPALVAAHLQPEPEVALGRLLARHGLVSAMIDMSDGLATDLAHICAESGAGAVVAAADLPMHPDLRRAAESLGVDALELSLCGGEDYALLFTCRPRRAAELEQTAKQALGRRLWCVGRIVSGAGVTLEEGGRRREIGYRGHEHVFG